MSSSGTLASGTGDALLVDLLETQVETLRGKLEATQVSFMQRFYQNFNQPMN